jgi:transketolase
MALYPIFADIEYFDPKELDLFTQPGGLLGLYADYRVPGIEGISGSLGHGIGMASGFIFSDRLDQLNRNVFVVIGDGECYEGSIWEAAMFAAHHKLNNLKVVLDRNQLCILGNTEDLVELGNLEEKWKSFGWNVISIDGHDYEQIDSALMSACDYKDGPSIIIANTVKGKGVSFMEGNAQWHNKIPTEELFAQAFLELERD